MKTVCAWCQCFMGGDPNASKDNTSHTICDLCLEKYFPEYPKEANNA